ncbi:hypothetical protein GCK72_008755 [Caenorhabditis remanei]|uniref:Uncharacterized protein n=1 Tax=Caenorhabditis remanei TaxID=31234 RepID=A0A6A5H142_CAERE|nr:hypothetical protein GCK72_008755 [Caenorhabditis remanei]KAF1760506.1 hypothetical protein GCK72_008755 [Caenorhabditis remanei]
MPIASNPAATTTTVNAEEARPDTPYPESTTPRAGTPEPKALLAVIRQKELWGDEGRPPGNGTADRTGHQMSPLPMGPLNLTEKYDVPNEEDDREMVSKLDTSLTHTVILKNVLATL